MLINRPLSEITEERTEESKVISMCSGYNQDKDQKDFKVQLPAAIDSTSNRSYLQTRSHYTHKSTTSSKRRAGPLSDHSRGRFSDAISFGRRSSIRSSAHEE